MSAFCDVRRFGPSRLNDAFDICREGSDVPRLHTDRDFEVQVHTHDPVEQALVWHTDQGGV